MLKQNNHSKTSTIDRTSLPYRKCVGIALANADNKIFVAKRIDSVDAKQAWQMPQGGVDDGEDIFDACLRELKEETSVENVELIATIEDWLYYDLPDDLVSQMWEGKYRGQMQKWFLLRFLGSDDEIDIMTKEQEFLEWKWVDIETIPDMIVPFKYDIYKMVVKNFSEYL